MLNSRQMQVHIAAESRSRSPLHLHPPAYLYTRNIGTLYFYFILSTIEKARLCLVSSLVSFLFSLLL
jgi:hypothetical protein